MENIKVIEISTTGNVTGRAYTGTFKVKGILTRRDQFLADANRRRIIGPNPADALPALQGEAFMIAQLSVRVVEAPEWWTATSNGELLEDGNIIAELFESSIKAEDDFKNDLSKQAEKALEKLSKDVK